MGGPTPPAWSSTEVVVRDRGYLLSNVLRPDWPSGTAVRAGGGL